MFKILVNIIYIEAKKMKANLFRYLIYLSLLLLLIVGRTPGMVSAVGVEIRDFGGSDSRDSDSRDSWSGDSDSRDSWSGDSDSRDSWSGDSDSRDSWSGDSDSRDSWSGDSDSRDSKSEDSSDRKTDRENSGNTDNSKSDASKSDASKSDASKSDASKSDASKSDASKSDASKSDASKSDMSKSDVSKSDVSKSDTENSDTSKSDTSKSDASKSDVSKSDTENSDASKSDTAGNENKRSSSHSSSSSGIGLVPIEPASNVYSRELVTRSVTSAQHVKFDFVENVTCITHIEFDPVKTFRRTTTTAEVLKNRSVFVPEPSVGKRYKYVDIWIEKGAGLPTSLKNGLVGFKVEKPWINESNVNESLITLQMYDKGWQPLPTGKTGEDENYVYYEANVSSYSCFAITEYTGQNGTLGNFRGVGNEVTASNAKEKKGPIENPMGLAKILMSVSLPLFLSIVGYCIIKKKI
jgi:clumping factor A